MIKPLSTVPVDFQVVAETLELAEATKDRVGEYLRSHPHYWRAARHPKHAEQAVRMACTACGLTVVKWTHPVSGRSRLVARSRDKAPTPDVLMETVKQYFETRLLEALK